MALSATINTTGADLFATIAGASHQGNARRFKRSRDAFLRALRSQQWQRVNQFDVQSSCDGLVEKFFVLNRQDLAEALSDRLKELSKRSSRWIPEILALLLHLQGDPVNESRVEDLENLKPPAPPPELTWADIIADDPLDEEGVWDDIDYERFSDEELLPEPKQPSRSRRREITPASSLDDDDWIAAAQACVVSPDPTPLRQVADGQFWRTGEHQKSMTELQAVRETLFMLAGLSTSLYHASSEKKIGCNANYSVTHVMASTWRYALQEFADIGTGLSQLRAWTKENQSTALLQTFRSAVLDEIRSFDKSLSELQATYLDSRAVAVSLTDILSKVRPQASLRLRLKDLIQNASQNVQRTPFVLLEALYDEINLAQMTGEAAVFAFLGRIFFSCLQTYLKPIRRWMTQGELGTDDQIFFVGTADKSSDAASLWHDQYVLRQDGQGKLHAPSFLHPAARKIFNSGKSVVFLRELEKYDRTVSTGQAEPPLDMESVCSSSTAMSALPLVSFSSLFTSAFDDWIRSKYTFASSVLRRQLFSDCGLMACLEALELVYFSVDGTLFQAFADALFDKIDRGRDGWNDRFLLTEIARGVFGCVASVRPERLGVRTAVTREPKRSVKALASIHVDYHLPWSVANIVQRAALSTYQRVFTLLLQIYRARFVLRSAYISSLSYHHQQQELRIRTLLRHRLLWFADTLHAYVTSTAIASSTSSLRSVLTFPVDSDIDALAAAHAAFVGAVERRCLLTPNLQSIADAVVEVLDLAVRFSDLVNLSGESGAAAAAVAVGPGTGVGVRRGSAATAASTATATYRRRRRRAPGDIRRRSALPPRLGASSSSSSDDTDNDNDGDKDADIPLDEYDSAPPQAATTTTSSSLSPQPQSEKSSLSQLRDMKAQFDSLHRFVLAGLRGVGRAGDEPCWDMLAERLEWEDVVGQGVVGLREQRR